MENDKLKKFLPLVITAIFVGGFCGVCGLLGGFGILAKLSNKTNVSAISVENDGSVVVEPTAAAIEELSLQTQVAAMQATQQHMINQLSDLGNDIPAPENLFTSPTPNISTDQDPPPANAVTISVSENTNCRSGPGRHYKQLGIVYIGQSIEALGVDDSGAYYIVRMPNGQTCWLWSHYANVKGDKDSLVKVTPPPPPKTVTLDQPWDWKDIIIKSNDFSWSGEWVLGAEDGMTLVNLTNEYQTCQECFRLKSSKFEIVQSGNTLNITWIEDLYWLDGSYRLDKWYGIAKVSDDNTIASGYFYLEEGNGMGYVDGEAIDIHFSEQYQLTFMLVQNGHPNQFIGSFCGSKNGAQVPDLCYWP